MNQSASILKIESTLARAKLLTNWSNNEPNNTIQLRNFHENQITKEIGISVARAKPFIWPCMISCMISCTMSYKKLWPHKWYHTYPFLALLWYCQKGMISYMISLLFIYIKYDIMFFSVITHILRYFFMILLTISCTYHIKSPLISELHDNMHDFGHDSAIWCHIFDDFIAYVDGTCGVLRRWLRGWMARVGGTRR